MTTTSTVEPATAYIVPAWITAWEAFIKAHHTFLIVGLTAAFLFFAAEKGISAYDRHVQRVDGIAAVAAANTAKTAEQQAQADLVTNAQLQAQLAQVKAQADLNQALLEGQLKLLQSKTQRQIQVDKSLPNPDLANRWAVLANEQSTEFSATTSGITASTKAAQATVEALENIPLYQQQLITRQAELIDAQKELTASTALVSGLTKTVADDRVALSTEKASHSADVAELKAEIKTAKRGAFWKGFKWGFVAGVATTVAVVVH
jgi:hypothetical protein